MRNGVVGGLSRASVGTALVTPTALAGSFALTDRARALRLPYPADGFGWLFARGLRGAWYDPSDRTTLFQDLAGTVPVTAYGQPVGVMLDKSGTGAHMTAQSDARRPTWQRDARTGKPYVRFDGVDDVMVSPSIDWGEQTKVTVCAAIQKDRDDVPGRIIVLGGGGNQLRTWSLVAPTDAGSPLPSQSIAFATRGDTAFRGAVFTDPLVAAPVACVVTGRSDVLLQRTELRVDGILRVANTSSSAMPSFETLAPLVMGRTVSDPTSFPGRIYQLIVTHGAYLSEDPRDQTLAVVERLMAQTLGSDPRE